MTSPQPTATAMATPTITSQCVSSAIVWVASVVHQTEASATIAPTDRSMPPPMITKVIPMLTTPITDAARRMVRLLSMLANCSPAVTTPTTQISSSATTRPGVAADAGAQHGEERVALLLRLERGLFDAGTVLAHAGTFPSMTRSRTVASSSSGGGGLVDDLALADDEDPVGETEHLLDLAGDDHDGDAAVGQRTDQLVDLGAGADVDAAGGLVEQQHPAVAQQPPGQHDLLLVAAGQGAHRAGDAVGTYVEAGGQLGRPASLLAAVEEAAAGRSGSSTTR